MYLYTQIDIYIDIHTDLRWTCSLVKRLRIWVSNEKVSNIYSYTLYHIYIHVYNIYVSLHSHAHTCTHTHTHIHTYSRTLTLTHKHTHAHTHTYNTHKHTHEVGTDFGDFLTHTKSEHACITRDSTTSDPRTIVAHGRGGNGWGRGEGFEGERDRARVRQQVCVFGFCCGYCATS